MAIGKNILDNLTTGMYSDSKVIYREYIQNACDQIDIAVREGLIKYEEALVDIYIDEKKRYISIKDNATGVKSSVFKEDLGDIANSNKEIGKNKGFRGIGRLCGLAYCKTLKFSTSYSGETKKSIMICDAQEMRKMLYDNKKYTLEEVWSKIVSFESEEEEISKHYFEVEMFDINKENTDLLDSKAIREYLNFVAPVPYKNVFHFRSLIYKFAESIDYKIDEYKIMVNGYEIFKEYTKNIKEESGNRLKNCDEIFNLQFKEFLDYNGKRIAWMWYGLSRFEKQIPKVNSMRGLRLRSANIQIGNDNTLESLFKESRGNYYFVGEVFAIDKGLIPNSQRDYFNENESRVLFEDLLREYFYDVLHKIYYDANNIKNAYKKQEDYIQKVKTFESKSKSGSFVDENDKQKHQFDLEKAKLDAENAKKKLSKYNFDETENTPIAEIYRNISKKFNSEKLEEKFGATNIPVVETNRKSYITSGMSKLSRSERKIVSKILTIITDEAPKEIAEKIIERIKEEMK